MLKIVKEGSKLEDRALDEIYAGYSDECGQSCCTSCPWGNLDLLKSYKKSHDDWFATPIW